MAKNLKLKAARAVRDMTQADLAAAVGVSRQTINAIEKGEYNPTINLCRSICRVLGKTLDELFWEEEAMNLREIFKRENLDEMQKQTLLKIESRGFWGLWVLLLAALIIESLLGFAPREMAAEWFIFMLGSAYSVISDLRAGIWDRHLKANTKTNAVVSVAGGAAVFVWGLIKFAALGTGIAVLQAVIMGGCTWVLCFALLQLSMKAYKKRHAELENPKEDDDENE